MSNPDSLLRSSLNDVDLDETDSLDSACNAFKSNDVYFQNNIRIKSLLRYLVDSRSFSLNNIKRGISRYFTSIGLNSHLSPPLFKPHALNVHDMFDPVLFRSGSTCLDPSTYSLQPSIMAHFHVASCVLCHPFHDIQPTCYFFSMLRCITHGWHIPCDYPAITPLYHVSSNYPAVALYDSHVEAEIDKMCATHVLHPIPRSSARFITPINAVIKNSDRNRARAIAQIEINDQLSLSRASAALVAQGLPKIKIRLTTDHSATGLNFCSYSPPFSYPTIADALKIITRNCYMCVGDIERYFHSYPTAWDDRTNFCIQYKGVTWCYSKCCFGHTACPYYTSTFGAEYYRWFNSIYHIPCSYIVDDWLTAAASLASSLHQMKTISTVLESCGFAMNEAKFKSGQQIVFLGILIDSVTMTVRFDPVSAKSFRVELQIYFDLLLDNKHLDINLVRPICGKLNWYAELVQSGRMHIQSFWNYFRHHKRSYSASMIQLRKDMQWWIRLLTSWENDKSTDLVYRILSADALASDKESIYVVQSDASGVDGYGYFHSHLYSRNPEYVSKRWDGSLRHANNSMYFELYALLDFLKETVISNRVLVWITDNESSTWGINKGNCKDPNSRILLAHILELCDLSRLQIIALWVPREQNQFADYLSHLSTYLDRSTVYGRLGGASTNRDSTRGQV